MNVNFGGVIRLSAAGEKGCYMRREDERKRGLTQSVQMALWVVLILVQMAVVCCLEAWADVRTDFTEDEMYQVEMKEVVRDVIYRQVEGAAHIPKTFQVQLKQDGKEYAIVCEKQAEEVLRECWSEGFSVPLTFYIYDAEYYQIGDKVIPRGNEPPEPEICGRELLGMLGLSGNEYRITELLWDGAEYVDEDGVLCRNGLAVGEKLLRDYQVRYTGLFRIPGHSMIAEESAEALEETEGIQEEQSVMESKKETKVMDVHADGTLRELYQKITRALLFAVGLGFILFFAGIALLAVLWVAKKWRRWYNLWKYNERRG